MATAHGVVTGEDGKTTLKRPVVPARVAAAPLDAEVPESRTSAADAIPLRLLSVLPLANRLLGHFELTRKSGHVQPTLAWQGPERCLEVKPCVPQPA